MCAAAHAWVGLGKVVYAASAAQLPGWRVDRGLPESPVRTLSITDVAPGVDVVGPVEPYDEEIRAIDQRAVDR